MTLLHVAVGIAERIPETSEYFEERDFCWLAAGQAALELGRSDVVELAITRLGRERTGARMRLAAIAARSPLRERLLAEFLDELEDWHRYLSRLELSDLAGDLVESFGVAAVAAAADRLPDLFTRTTWLVELAERTRDAVLQRSLLATAHAHAVDAVPGNRDYALKHVAAGYMEVRLFDEARAAIDEMDDDTIRLDYLRWLAEAAERAGEHDRTAEASAEVAAIEEGTPGIEGQSEMLAMVGDLLNERPPGDDSPSPVERAASLAHLVLTGQFDAAIDTVLREWPARFCAVSLHMAPEPLERLLLAQVEAVLGFRRNDLKVEFVTELAVAVAREGTRLPAAVIDALQSARFRQLEPAAPPSPYYCDYASLDFDAFVRVLFDRPVPANDEEKRIMWRERDDDALWGDDPERLVMLAARLFREFGDIAPRYSAAQVDQAMWLLNSYPVRLSDALFGGDASLESVLACIGAVPHVFADYVRVTKDDDRSAFDMWWDLWRDFGEDRKPPAVQDALLESMVRVLDMDDQECREAALHGLNHFEDPRVPRVVDAYLARRGSTLDPEEVEYALACRNHEAL